MAGGFCLPPPLGQFLIQQGRHQIHQRISGEHFGAAGAACVLFAGAGVSQRYAANLPAGSFWAWKLVLPGLLIAVLLIAVATQLAVETAPGRRLGAVVGVLGDQDASQSRWWWVGWLGMVWCAGSLVLLAFMERRRQALLNARRGSSRKPSRR